ncbi:MAG: TonB-dependent receptor [Spongiibacteraceae bacterium]|jgi:iron complex outermembrane receptor protein|nr:TonB-dependent receptor [Spongiibacteraceae bacterium]
MQGSKRVLAVLIGTFAAMAQAQSDSAGGRVATGGLEEVIVTAERRQSSLQETPLSIVSLGGDTLQMMDINDMESLQDFVANVSIGRGVEGGTAPLFMIRGVGGDTASISGDRGVGLYIDDVFFSRVQGSQLEMLDMNRIEVLRGPQGTLFGRNTTGGAIRYISNKPTDTFEGFIQGAMGSDGREDFQALVNIPFTDKVLGRFQIASFDQDAYVKSVPFNSDVPQMDDMGDQDSVGAAAKLRFLPTDDLTIDFGASYSKSESAGPAMDILTAAVDFQTIALGGVTDGFMDGLPVPPLGGSDGRLLPTPAIPNPAVTDRYLLNDPYKHTGDCYLYSFGADLPPESPYAPGTNFCNWLGEENELTALHLDIAWDISDALKLRSITGYIDTQYKGGTTWGGYGTMIGHRNSDVQSFSQELQLLGETGRSNWVVGVYYSTDDAREDDDRVWLNIWDAGTPADMMDDLVFCCDTEQRKQGQETDSFGIFGQLTYSITERLKTTLGLRYSYDKKSAWAKWATKWNQFTDPAVNVTGVYLPADGLRITAEDSWEALDYRATLDYQITDDLMIYGTVSRGYKSGGININLEDEQAAFNPDHLIINNDPNGFNGGMTSYDPETVTNYEVGVRSEWFDGRARLNVTYFKMDYEDMQLLSPINPLIPTRPPFSYFLNAAKVDIDGVEVDAQVAVTRNLTLHASLGTLDATVEKVSNPFVASVIAEGSTIARAPELSYTLGANYSHQLAHGGTIDFTVNYGFTDEQETNNSSVNSMRLDDYYVVTSRLQYTSPQENWRIALFCTNCTDNEYYTGGAYYRSFFGTTVGHIARPREWVAELKYSF